MRFWLHFRLTGLLLASLGPSTKVSAQAPDIRNIRPHVMLLVDTSGSMERKPDCICTTPACLECLPVCSPGAYEENRWSVVAQALTGEFSPYECNSETRIGGIYAGEYDEGYFLPHIQLPQETRGVCRITGRKRRARYLPRAHQVRLDDVRLDRHAERPAPARHAGRLPGGPFPGRVARHQGHVLVSGTTLPTRSRAPAAWSTCSTTGRAPSSRPKAAW